jgi:outer membrane protein TolC
VRLTLAEAVRTALLMGREGTVAAREADGARFAVTRARAGRLPRLDAFADYTILSAAPAAVVNGREVQMGDARTAHGRLSAEQLLYDFGRTGSRVERSVAASDGAAWQEAAVRERLAMDAVSAFLGVRRASELAAAAREALATAESHLAVASTLYEGGAVARNDLLSAEVAVANARAQVVSAENREALSRSILALRIGLPGDREAEADPGPLPEPAVDGGTGPGTDRDALARRADLLARDAAVREAEGAVAQARSEFAPSLFVQGGYAYDGNDYNPNTNLWSLVLGGRWNLFNGFADRAAEAQERARLSRRREERSFAGDGASLEVKAARLSLAESRERLAAAETAVAKAEENLRIQDERYREGIAISAEQLDAQSLLSRAKADRANASFDLLESRYRLLYARGEILPYFGGKGSPAGGN